MPNKRFNPVENAYQTIDHVNRNLSGTGIKFRIEQYAKDNFGIVYADNVPAKAQSFCYKSGMSFMDGLDRKELYIYVTALYNLSMLLIKVQLTPEEFAEKIMGVKL